MIRSKTNLLISKSEDAKFSCQKCSSVRVASLLLEVHIGARSVAIEDGRNMKYKCIIVIAQIIIILYSYCIVYVCFLLFIAFFNYFEFRLLFRYWRVSSPLKGNCHDRKDQFPYFHPFRILTGHALERGPALIENTFTHTILCVWNILILRVYEEYSNCTIDRIQTN